MAWMSGTAFRVRPHDRRLKTFERVKIAFALYHWVTCLFVTSLVFSQLLGAVWDSKTTVEHHVYGRSPLLGPSQIVGTNDVPFPDRVIACVHKGHSYKPKLVSSLLADPGVSAILVDSTGTALHGYRLRQRRVGNVIYSLDSSAQTIYEKQCALIANTTSNILASCLALGYTNLTRYNLHVVDDWDSKNLYELVNTLPVLIMPYWDNAAYARHAVPTWNGDACIFRLEDAFTGNGGVSAMASFRGVNQSVRHSKTTEWLNRPGGHWKNGWYQDGEGMRWYSDVISSAKGAPYFMMHRVFDMRTGEELDCSNPTDCEAASHIERWGDKFNSGSRAHNFNSVYIANGTEFGLGLYESYEFVTVHSVFDWETLISNLSVGLVLFRWIVALASLHLETFYGKSMWFGGGIGCVSGSSSFAWLPIVSLSRLKMTLAAFWTAGCKFEGQQNALAETWFFMYPAIVQFVLIYFSLLNSLAKALRRRVSDVLFAPTVLILCLMHYYRLSLAESGWMTGVDGRVSTVIFSNEVENLQLADYFTTDTAWRMNGRVTLLFALKLAILAVNLLPLLIAHPVPINKRENERELHGVENALAVRARHVGGLGRSLTYMAAVIDRKERRLSSASFAMNFTPPPSPENECLQGTSELNNDKTQTLVTPILPLFEAKNCTNPPQEQKREIALVNSYELIRLGYLIFGDKYLITFDEWDLLSSMAPLRSFLPLVEPPSTRVDASTRCY